MFNNNNKQNNINNNFIGEGADGSNTSGRDASNNQGLGSPSLLDFHTPMVERQRGSSSRGAATPLAPVRGGKITDTGVFLKNSGEFSGNFVSRLEKLDTSVLTLLVQLSPMLKHFVTVPSDPSAFSKWRRSVFFVMEKSVPLQQECQMYLNAIADYDALAPEGGSKEEMKEHEEMRQITLLSLRDGGQFSKVIPVVSSSESQFTEITISAPPFSLKFRIACDQAAITRDKADSSEKSAVEAAMSKTLIGSGVKVDLPITAAVGEDGALSKLAALFHALRMMTGQERITELKLVRLINWAFAGNASSTWTSTGMEDGEPVALEKRLLSFIGRYAVGTGAISGMKTHLRGLAHFPRESLLSFVNRVDIYVSCADVEMQRVAIEDFFMRIDEEWQSKNQVLFERFKEQVKECKGVMNPWQYLHNWVVKHGFSERRFAALNSGFIRLFEVSSPCIPDFVVRFSFRALRF